MLQSWDRCKKSADVKERGPLMGCRSGSHEIPWDPQGLAINQFCRQGLEVLLRGSPKAQNDPLEPVNPATGPRCVFGEVVLQQSRIDCVESRAEIQKQDPGIGSGGFQVLEEEVEGHVDGIVYRSVGSVGQL